MAVKKNLRGRLAIVTGAEGGIGRCFCETLAARGCSLLMVGIQDGPLAATAAEVADRYGVGAYPLRLDLTRPDATQKILEWLDERELTPYILINNAGIFSFRPVTETDERKVACFIDLHVRAVTELTRAVAQRMARAGEGRVLNMSSMSCWMPMPGIALYSATKAYIRVLTRAMHYELRDSGVTLTAACPGGIATDLFGLSPGLQRLAVRIGALATPEKFARKAVNRMLRGRRQYINGPLNRFSIFFVSILPTPVRMLIKRLMLDKGITR